MDTVLKSQEKLGHMSLFELDLVLVVGQINEEDADRSKSEDSSNVSVFRISHVSSFIHILYGLYEISDKPVIIHGVLGIVRFL